MITLIVGIITFWIGFALGILAVPYIMKDNDTIKQ
jgi:hypothetical protein